MGFRDRGQGDGGVELGDCLKSWDIFNLPPLLARCITCMDGYCIYRFNEICCFQIMQVVYDQGFSRLFIWCIYLLKAKYQFQQTTSNQLNTCIKNLKKDMFLFDSKLCIYLQRHLNKHGID